jgi:hypothetical protein
MGVADMTMPNYALQRSRPSRKLSVLQSTPGVEVAVGHVRELCEFTHGIDADTV